MPSEERDTNQQKPLVSVEFQNEIDIATGKRQQRMFIKMYFEARDSGLLAAIGDRRWRTLCCLATYMDENGYCYPSQARMARDLGIHRQRVNERIKELVIFRFGGKPVVTLHHAEQPREQGRWGHNVYEIHQIAGLTIFDKHARDTTPVSVSGKPDTAHSQATVSANPDTMRATVSASAVSVEPDTNQNQDTNQTHTRVFSSQNTETGQAELVAFFHQKAGHAEAQQNTAKELKQAKDILDAHGLETGKAIVTFALEKARETSYKPRTFGAVLQYVPEALAALEGAKRRKERETEERRRRGEEEARIKEEREAYLTLPREERIERSLARRVAVFKTLQQRQPTDQELDELRRRIMDRIPHDQSQHSP